MITFVSFSCINSSYLFPFLIEVIQIGASCSAKSYLVLSVPSAKSQIMIALFEQHAISESSTKQQQYSAYFRVYIIRLLLFIMFLKTSKFESIPFLIIFPHDALTLELCYCNKFCCCIDAVYKLIQDLKRLMSYKSKVESLQSHQNRKISFNIMQTHTRDSSEQAYSSKSHHSLWSKELNHAQEFKQGRVAEEQEYVLSIKLYNEHFDINCKDQDSIGLFVEYIDQKVSIKNETKIALILMITQKAYDLNIACGDIFKNAIEKYQSFHLRNLFN